MTVVSHGLDYSAARIPAVEVKANGYEVVRRYLWFNGQRHAYLTADETQDMLRNGVQVDAIYEQNTNDPAGGYAGGQRMATQAVASSRGAGLPQGSLIYMCADAWLSTHGIPLATAMDFLRGSGQVIRAAGYRVGAYGFADFIFEAARLGLADAYWLAGAEIPANQRPAWLTSWQNNRGYVYVRWAGRSVTCDHNDNYRHSGINAPGGGGGAGGFPVDTVQQIEQIHQWFFRGGAWLNYWVEHGRLPDEAAADPAAPQPGSIVALLVDQYRAVRTVWEQTGLTMGQALKQLVDDPDNPMTDEQADRAAARMAEAVAKVVEPIPGVTVDLFTDALAKGRTPAA